MHTLKPLLESIAVARQQFIQSASGLTYQQSQFKPSAEEWSIVDNVEHMVWAEMTGINGMWKALDGIKNNKPMWSGDAIHHGLAIETIIENTWKEKEQVPEISKPRWGGPIEYWISALGSCHNLLQSLASALDGRDLENIICPHAISGPLNVIQRFEFLRFHLNRHQRQIENIKTLAGFPSGQ